MLNDAVPDAVSKVIDASIQTLVDARALLSMMPFEQTVAAMQAARQLVFIGLGASGHVASDACHKYFRLGIPCSALTDGPGIAQFAAIAAPHDVLVFISTNGAWHDSARAAAVAVNRGATVIALTDPMSRLSLGDAASANLRASKDALSSQYSAEST